MQMETNSMAAPNRSRWWTMIAASLAIFMASLDMNILNVALPQMAADFRTSQIAWVTFSYTITGVAVITSAGRLCDWFGIKKTMLGGLVVFLVGSILCGMADSLGQMIVYRVIQGIGAAFITAPVMVIATILFPENERGKAMSVVGTVGPLGGIVGPSLGGVLTDLWNWNAVFFVNVPVGLTALVLLWRLLSDSPETKKSGFDWSGTVALTMGAVLILAGLSEGWGGTSITLLSAGGAVWFLFLFIEQRVKHPIIPVPVLRKASYALPLAGIIASSVVGSGIGFVLSFFLQQNLEFAPSKAGLTLLAVPLAMVIAAQIGGIVSDRFGEKMAASLGASISLLGAMLLIPLSPNWSMGDVMLRLLLIGLGQGLFASPANVAVMAATPREYLGVSGGVVNLFRQLGFAMGPAIATFIWIPEKASELSTMRIVFYVLLAVQCITLITTFGYLKKR